MALSWWDKAGFDAKIPEAEAVCRISNREEDQVITIGTTKIQGTMTQVDPEFFEVFPIYPLLISAIFNYINLNLALSGKRAKEMATRRLLGAPQGAIVWKYIGESILFMAVCFALALLLAWALLPMMNELLLNVTTDTGNTWMYIPVKMALRLVELFMILSVLIALLGLLAMSAYYSGENTKGIAVRKVFGSDVSRETWRTVKDYMVLVGIAVVIGIPVAVWMAGRYLSRYAYRIDGYWWIFVLAAVIAVAIAFGSVLWQTLKAAKTNPAIELKKE